MKEYIYDDISIKIGENAMENWKLLDISNENFPWLHLKSFPSGYTIICDNNPSKKIIKIAANLCKRHTKYRNMQNIKVSQTICGNVIKGGKLGEAIFKSNKKVKDIKI